MTQDSMELEALFDSVAQQHWGNQPHARDLASDSAASATPIVTGALPAKKSARKKAAKASRDGLSTDAIINQVGQLTRSLHDNLRALGYDRELERAATSIPDARDRLCYVAKLTQQAAERVLNATDVAKPLQAALEQDASSLVQRWDSLFDGKMDVESFRQLAYETQRFLKSVPSTTQTTSAQLLEIMMAQDFQDLTGQVLKKVTTLVQDVEAKLLRLLIDHVPNAAPSTGVHDGLEGPVVNAQGRPDVVTSQEQVDDLLASLGF